MNRSGVLSSIFVHFILYSPADSPTFGEILNCWVPPSATLKVIVDGIKVTPAHVGVYVIEYGTACSKVSVIKFDIVPKATLGIAPIVVFNPDFS